MTAYFHKKLTKAHLGLDHTYVHLLGYVHPIDNE
jgi:hypothetical protein